MEITAEGPALKVRVRAVPEDGAANAALVKTLAAWLGVPKSSVAVLAGAKSRLKAVHVAGGETDLSARLTRRLDAAPHRSGPDRTARKG